MISDSETTAVHNSSFQRKCTFAFALLEAERALNKDELSRMGWTSFLPELPYGDKFRKHTRLMQEYFHPQVLWNRNPVIELEVAIFTEELVQTPELIWNGTRVHRGRCNTAVTLSQSCSWDCHENYLRSYSSHTVTSLDDIFVQTAESVLSRTVKIESTGGYWTSSGTICPFVNDFPQWYVLARTYFQ
jgi:hypothetical protein